MHNYQSACKQSNDPALHNALSYRDFHVHTCLSPCGKDPGWIPEAIVTLAEELNMETVVLADHYYERRAGFTPPPFYSSVDETGYESSMRAVESMKTSVEVLVSCEIDMIRPGLFTLSETFARKLPAGLVSASHYHLEGIEQPNDRSPEGLGRYMLERMQAAIEWPPAQILAHPLTALQGSLGELGEVLDTIADENFKRVLSSAREKNVAVEIRASMFNEEIPHHDHIMRFYSMVREEGCKIAPASDAHSATDFGSTSGIIPWAEKLGFRASDVIDSDWLESHKST